MIDTTNLKTPADVTRAIHNILTPYVWGAPYNCSGRRQMLHTPGNDRQELELPNGKRASIEIANYRGQFFINVSVYNDGESCYHPNAVNTQPAVRTARDLKPAAEKIADDLIAANA